jgi:choice-of-anchor A domain-containing protein
MGNRPSKLLQAAFLAAIFALVLAVALPERANASVIDLGAAGQFAVLALNGGIDDSGPFTSPANVSGDVGLASSGQQFQASGSVQYDGRVYLRSGDSYNSSAPGVPQPTMGPAVDAFLGQARTDALNGSAIATLLGQNPTATYGTINSNFSIAENAQGSYVFNLQGIDFSGGKTLTLSAPAGSSFLLNISTTFKLTTGSILLGGGLHAADVLYNYTGAADVQFSGGGNASVVYGTILAPNATIGLHPGAVFGSVIGSAITMSSGAQVIGVIPEVTPGSVIFGFLGLVVAVASRRAIGRQPQRARARKRF